MKKLQSLTSLSFDTLEKDQMNKVKGGTKSVVADPTQNYTTTVEATTPTDGCKSDTKETMYKDGVVVAWCIDNEGCPA